MELKGKRAMVIGLGISGTAAARLMAARGAHLVLTDRRESLGGDFAAEFPAATIHLGAEDSRWLKGVDLVVASPGVAPSSILLRAARAAGIPLIGELELASRFIERPIVAVTGTNGKSTVAVMLGEIFRHAGYKAFVGGNLGTALADAVVGDHEIVVAEVSSYQLELIESFKPRVAIYLNLSDDHLDRYASFEEYGAAKARIFINQDNHDWAVLNRDDPQVWKLADKIAARVISYGAARTHGWPALMTDGDRIIFDSAEHQAHISLREFKLFGAHNRSNAMAAAAAGLAMRIAPAVIEQALENCRSLPHRIELAGQKRGVTYIDDSKGTNIGAVIEALATVPAPVILLAGGVDKGGDYAPLIKPLRDKVRLLVLYGEAREKIGAALVNATRIELVTTLAEAVRVAASRANSGDTVLLSPACSSFDQFKDYAERGRVFQDLVRAL
jgi:UDP-N-acetylmuramoylalanine--D-glutamate ligase